VNDFSSDMEQYILDHTDPESDLLKELWRETNLKVYHPRMISGHLQGKILAAFCRMIKPLCVLEIGTFTGYSAISMANALPEKGELFTIEINDELADMALSYFQRAGLSEKIHYLSGNALNIIPSLPEMFDLVFIDGEKSEYCRYYHAVIDKVKPGGFIIADNVLWNGKVLQENLPDNDYFTRGIIEFNNLVQADERVFNVLFPVRDGLMVMQKK
jgi:caffeoyl-CoA O-methyltransferase